MIRAISLLSGVALAVAPSVCKAGPSDKDMHFVAGAAIAAGDSASLTLLVPEIRETRRWAHAAGVCAAAAAGKEALDEFQGSSEADPWDFAATLGGCSAGLLIGQGFAVIAGPERGELRLRVEF